MQAMAYWERANGLQQQRLQAKRATAVATTAIETTATAMTTSEAIATTTTAQPNFPSNGSGAGEAGDGGLEEPDDRVGGDNDNCAGREEEPRMATGQGALHRRSAMLDRDDQSQKVQLSDGEDGVLPNKKVSNFKGVCWDPQVQQWLATISFQGKKRTIGHFDDQEAAARAYDQKAKLRKGCLLYTSPSPRDS